MSDPILPISVNPPLDHALFRVSLVCDNIRQGGYHPGIDVSLFRALRELHRCLSTETGEQFDPHRLVRAMLFHGLSEFSSWTEVPADE
jgi:hypothetical protein